MTPNAALFIRTELILTPTETLNAHIYLTDRHSGRRIVVRDQRGRFLFDTSDCYDEGNARRLLERWLDERARQAEPVLSPEHASFSRMAPADVERVRQHAREE